MELGETLIFQLIVEDPSHPKPMTLLVLEDRKPIEASPAMTCFIAHDCLFLLVSGCPRPPPSPSGRPFMDPCWGVVRS